MEDKSLGYLTQAPSLPRSQSLLSPVLFLLSSPSPLPLLVAAASLVSMSVCAGLAAATEIRRVHRPGLAAGPLFRPPALPYPGWDGKSRCSLYSI